ncbi:hypothetical protein PENTCL1PPCAC_20858 [Pristionchus entomophagus]|uniref:Uncharacterized protein n=1 Tax=Pristionchus entomophagus TaxID=358040 RepID=A0AAV5TVW1_9BILA|nr:hypothetical protein PENTCL1PPCAC_20844 [Pristionchus entomophagus]GMS98683.1 hypothetical protein PENTCL1PPCAC_20858 [Pristionchus entomophagus]
MRLLLPLILLTSAQGYVVKLINMQDKVDLPVRVSIPGQFGVNFNFTIYKGQRGPGGNDGWTSEYIRNVDTITVSVNNLFARFTPEDARTTRYTVGTNFTVTGSDTPPALRMSLEPDVEIGSEPPAAVFECNFPFCGKCTKQGQVPADPKVVKWSRQSYKHTALYAYKIFIE